MEAGGSQLPRSSGQPEGNITTRTGIRAPGTIVKPPQSSRLNTHGNYLGQNKFRIINPNGGSHTLIRPLQRLQLQHEQLTHSDHLLLPSSTTTSSASNALNKVQSQQQQQQQPPPSQLNPTQQLQANTKTITRIPAKPLGLARPTPIRQIATSVSQQGSLTNLVSHSSMLPTSGQSSRLPSSLSASNSKLATLRPQSHGPTSIKSPASRGLATGGTIRATVSSTTLEKPKALPRARVSPNRSLYIGSLPEPETRSRTTTTTTSVVTSSQLLSSGSSAGANSSQHITNIIDLSTVENDVGQIRRLLEQLLVLLQASQKDQEAVVTENESLKREVADLKSKIRAIRSTVAASRDSGYSLKLQTPVQVRQQQIQQPQQQQQQQQQNQKQSRYDDGESEPSIDSEARDDDFLTDTIRATTTTSIVGRDQYGSTGSDSNSNSNNNNNNNNNSGSNQRGPSSVYLSPYI